MDEVEKADRAAHNATNRARSASRRHSENRASRMAKIAVMRAFGLTMAELAQRIGITKKMAEHYVETSRAFFVDVEGFIAEIRRHETPLLPKLTIEPIDPANYNEEEASKRLGEAINWAAETGDNRLVISLLKELHKIKGLGVGKKPPRVPATDAPPRLVPSPVAKTLEARAKRTDPDADPSN